MCKEFKSERAIVRVFGVPNQQRIEKATITFLKGVENEKKKKIKNLGTKILVWIMLIAMVGSFIASLVIYFI